MRGRIGPRICTLGLEEEEMVCFVSRNGWVGFISGWLFVGRGGVGGGGGGYTCLFIYILGGLKGGGCC